MVVLGIDVGTRKTCMASPSQHILKVVLNEQSKRYTPTAVGFAQSEGRVNGDEAMQKIKRRPKDVIVDIKRLIGRRFSDARLDEDRAWWGFDLVPDPDDPDMVCIAVNHMGTTTAMRPEQILACYLSYLKEMAKTSLKTSDVKDCAIAVPCYFTEPQRRAVMDAGKIAGLSVLQVVNEVTAIVLAHGMMQLHPVTEGNDERVLFVDIGYGNAQAAIAVDSSQESTVMAHSGSPYCGGRELDRCLVRHFAKQVQAQLKVDVFDPKHRKLLLKMMDAAERLKKLLSANSEAVYTIDYLYDDQDFTMRLTRDEFDDLILPIVKRMIDVIVDVYERVKAMDAIARKKLEDGKEMSTPKYKVEITGGIVRIPLVQTMLKDWCQRNLPGFEVIGTSMNGDESVAKGCALICAKNSTHYQVRKYALNDSSYYDILLHWSSNVSEWDSWKEYARAVKRVRAPTEIFPERNSSDIFLRDRKVPVMKLINLEAMNTLLVTSYKDPSRLYFGQPTFINVAEIRAPEEKKEEEDVHETKVPNKLQINIKMDVNMRRIVSAQLVKKVRVPVKEKPAPEAKDDKKADDAMDATSAAAAAADAPTPDSKEAEAMHTDAPASPPTEEAPKVDPAPASTEKPADGQKKFKTKLVKTEVQVLASCLGLMSDARLANAVQMEQKMMRVDQDIKELMFARDQVEGFSYSLRDSLEDPSALKEFVGPAIQKELLDQCEKLTYWMEDEDPDKPYTKEDFLARYNKLKRQSDPIWVRRKQFEGRPSAVQQLKSKIVKYMANIKDPSLVFIEEEKRASVYKKCEEMDAWLIEMDIKQDKIPKYEDPVLTLEILAQKNRELSLFADPILNTPRPEPPKEEPAPADAKPEAGSSAPPEHPTEDSSGNPQAMDES